MLVGAVMSRSPVTADRDHTVLHVARLMREKNVGAVVVVDGAGRALGICTDRDIVTRAFAAPGNPAAHPVDRIMSKPVITVDEDTLLFDLLRMAAEKKVRRVPVVDPSTKKVIGMVSLDDALLMLTTELSNVAEVLGHSSKVLGARTPEEE
jgi:CBS domain-containing protein